MLEFYFDCSSPWTYLAFESIQAIASRPDVTIEYKPILVGGVFNTINPSVYESRANPIPEKARYYQKDMQDWARLVGVQIGAPAVFPVNSAKVMRGAFVAIEQHCLVPYARAAFQRYWSDLADISQDEEVEGIAEAAGLDAQSLLRRIGTPECKQLLRDSTEELMSRGGFGSPTMFLDGDDMYFGNDRIALLAATLDRQ
ncbi:MAG: 2-hydroxychromene-2-carboxylate isomerase [Gammaproteobacteria bacterium]|nr:2-hydroxychromene-2-carboxylate isomerase [Gammaproteobacteria bacterium]